MWQKLSFEWVLMIALGAAALPAIAADDHGHAKGPHGGDVKTFGQSHHVEGIRSGATVKIYLLDEGGAKVEKIEKHEGGNVTVLAAGHPQAKTDLTAGQAFSEMDVKVPEKGKVNVLVALKAGKESLKAKFVFE